MSGAVHSGVASAVLLAPPPAGLMEAGRAVVVRRARLWELNGSIHCSVIGTCLTTAELRKAMGRALRADVSRSSDHDLHAQAVGLCGHDNPVSRLLQRTLDGRHEVALRRFRRLQGEEAVLAAWAEARRAGDIPGAYWAVLTHPDLCHAGLRQAFGDVHMLSHLVGAANRADIRRLTALEAENAALRDKVEQQQMRLQEAVTTRDATIRQLGMVAARHIRAEPGPQEDALSGLRHLVADLQGRLDRDAQRIARLERRAAEAAQAAANCEARARAAQADFEAAEQELAALERLAAEPAPAHPAGAVPRTVLYVGGRPGAVDQMRQVLGARGGTLLSHDGGRHDGSSLLPGLIGQAGLVVFPVDCISHEAALTVKRLCRQLGTAWVPLRSSGLGSFLAILAQPPPDEVLP